MSYNSNLLKDKRGDKKRVKLGKDQRPLQQVVI